MNEGMIEDRKIYRCKHKPIIVQEVLYVDGWVKFWFYDYEWNLISEDTVIALFELE